MVNERWVIIDVRVRNRSYSHERVAKLHLKLAMCKSYTWYWYWRRERKASKVLWRVAEGQCLWRGQWLGNSLCCSGEARALEMSRPWDAHQGQWQVWRRCVLSPQDKLCVFGWQSWGDGHGKPLKAILRLTTWSCRIWIYIAGFALLCSMSQHIPFGITSVTCFQFYRRPQLRDCGLLTRQQVSKALKFF